MRYLGNVSQPRSWTLNTTTYRSRRYGLDREQYASINVILVYGCSCLYGNHRLLDLDTEIISVLFGSPGQPVSSILACFVIILPAVPQMIIVEEDFGPLARFLERSAARAMR